MCGGYFSAPRRILTRFLLDTMCMLVWTPNPWRQAMVRQPRRSSTVDVRLLRLAPSTPYLLLLFLNTIFFASADLCTPLKNVDCVGNDIAIIPNNTSPGECCAACKAHAGCVAWSWDYLADMNCFLKSACPKPISAGSISGYVDSPSSCPSPLQPSDAIWSCTQGNVRRFA